MTLVRDLSWAHVGLLLGLCGVLAARAEAAPVTVPVPVIPRAPFGPEAARLGEASTQAKLRHSVRLRAGTPFEITRGGKSVTGDFEVVLTVSAEAGKLLRVVVEEDGAMVQMWVPRSAALPAILAPIQLADAAGLAPATDAGAWLDPGAPITVIGKANKAGRRQVGITQEGVEVSGWVPQAVIGSVWVLKKLEPPDARASGGSSAVAASTGNLLVRRGAVRAAPREDAAVVANLVEDQVVAEALRDATGAWREIEIRTAAFRVVGFVAKEAVSNGGVGEVESSVGGYASDPSSHPDLLAVPAGACLYDRIRGEIIGVTSVTMNRQSRTLDARAGWHEVVIETVLGHVPVVVHVGRATAKRTGCQR
jgi:hypothetical protein